MLNTLIGKAKFGGVGGTGGIKYFKFVLLGGDGNATNYNGVGGRGGGGNLLLRRRLLLRHRRALLGRRAAALGGRRLLFRRHRR